MTNRERLEEAKIIKHDVSFTPEQEKAIESLSEQEVNALISVKNKLVKAFPAAGLPIQHHSN